MAHKVIDLHCDSVSLLMDGKNLLQPVPDAHLDLPRLRKGRVALQVFAAYIPPDEEKAFETANKKFDLIDAFVASDEQLLPVNNAAELREILSKEKTGIMKAIENGLAIENSLEKLSQMRQRNVRIMTLVHSRHLPWIASCTGQEPFSGGNDSGLSSFGEQVIDAMFDLGIIPDLSHASEKAFWDVLKRSKKPLIASHSCAYALCASPRNLKDDQLKALGDTGGVVGVNFYSGFLSEQFRQKYEKKQDSLTPDTDTEPVSAGIIVDHIDYMVNMAGEDCVALGSDFDGIPKAPEGVTGSDYYPVLEEELRSRAYTEKRIEKIFNGNFLRVFEAWD